MSHKTYLFHIGKCGGTSIIKALKEYSKLEIIHHIRPESSIFNQNHEIIILIRNPISRFVSAFNFSKAIINFDILKVKNPEDLNITNCIAPDRIRAKIRNQGISFTEDYDKLVSYFDNANSLAEALSSKEHNLNSQAKKLMNYPIEHLYKGIGWYLDNGDFVSQHHKRILKVIRIEYFDEDFQDLLNKKPTLNSPNNKLEKIRKNTSGYSKKLSKKGIESIINWYSASDYKALKELRNKNLINKSYLDECYLYNIKE